MCSSSSKGNLRKVPRLKFLDFTNNLWMPITLLVKELNMGAPEEPWSVLHLCLMSFIPSGSIPFPEEIYALPSFL